MLMYPARQAAQRYPRSPLPACRCRSRQNPVAVDSPVDTVGICTDQPPAQREPSC